MTDLEGANNLLPAIMPTDEFLQGHTFNKYGHRKAHDLAFFSTPRGHDQVGSDYRTAKFPPITSLPYIRSHLWLGELTKRPSFVRPSFFVWAATTGHIARFKVTQEPHIIRVRQGADESCSGLQRQTNVPEVDIWKQAPQGLQKTSLSGFQDSSLGACFLEHRKASFSGAGWG